MKTIQVSEDDANQIKAILLTHAELADNHSMPSLELIGRMKLEDQANPDDEVKQMIVDLQSQVDDFEMDCDNLKRLALLF